MHFVISPVFKTFKLEDNLDTVTMHYIFEIVLREAYWKWAYEFYENCTRENVRVPTTLKNSTFIFLKYACYRSLTLIEMVNIINHVN